MGVNYLSNNNKKMLQEYKQIAKDFFYPKRVIEELEKVDLTLNNDKYLASCNRIMLTAAKCYL